MRFMTVLEDPLEVSAPTLHWCWHWLQRIK